MKYPLDLTVMMYHYVRDPRDEAEQGSGIPGMPVRAFETQLDSLSRQYTFIRWPDLRMALQGKKPLPDSACLLTFDDGISDHYINVYKILQSRNLSGLFFALGRCKGDGFILAHKIHFLLAKLGLADFREAVQVRLDPGLHERFLRAEKRYRLKYPLTSTDNRINLLKAILQRELSSEVDILLSELFEMHVGSEQEIAGKYYLNPDQIREMRAGGMHFGGHSRHHPWFDWIDPRARAAEIRASSDWLRRYEPEPWAFAYPYGGLTEDSPGLLKEHGFVAAFTTRAQVRHRDPYFIGRLDGEEQIQDGNLHA
jgi:peptidoglycan/xylan/chitin deacetylase (PgdA/CDA1 family)